MPRLASRGRGQSNVVGVALLLGITVVSMGALTAAVGVVVDSNAAAADAERVAAGLDDAIEPVAATGPQRGEVTFTEGTLRPVERHVEVRADGEVVDRVAVDALVFEGDRRVAYHTGAVVRDTGQQSWLVREPPITVSDEVLVVGLVRLGDGVDAVSGTGGVTVTLRSDVTHTRESLGDAEFTLAIETSAPGAWTRYFEGQAAVTVEAGEPATVVVSFDEPRRGYLVVHDLALEVTSRG